MNSKSHDEQGDLDALRQLLFAPEQERIEQLAEHLESEEQFSTDVSEVLPQAMIKSAQRNEQLSQAMAPTVEQIVSLSIKRDINKFADMLYPVIGPAIRKSISEAIRQMLQSLNQSLENGFSWRGIKWRIESIRTGIPFAQIVMLNSLVYRVEQVFLIHRDTGLMLNHVDLEEGQSQDADMVSSMLSAISDFVGDSFDVKNRQELDSIQVGDVSIWIEQAPDVILAVAIRGNAPNKLRTIMQEVLEEVQSQFAQELSEFAGDTAVFDSSHEMLERCMQSQYESRKKNPSFIVRLIWLVAIGLLLYWLFSNIYLSMQQNNYIALLEKESGYVVTQVLHDGDELTVKGLRDPLAREPEALVALSTLNPDAVRHQFEPYQSLEKAFSRKRLVKMLELPESVSVESKGDLLVVRGLATKEWIDSFYTRAALTTGLDQIDASGLSSEIDLSSLAAPETVELSLDTNTGHLVATGAALKTWSEPARVQALNIAGIRSYDDSRLSEILDLSIFNPPETVSVTLVEGVLKASGQADSDWISSFEKMAKDHEQIKVIDSSQLLNSDEAQIRADIQALEQEVVLFDVANSYNVDASQAFNRVATLIRKIIDNAGKLSRPVRIIVRGHSDSVGNYQDNVFLSLERADYVAQSLFNTGINAKYLLIKGLEAPVKKETTEAERRYNRRVTFEVIITNL